MLAVKGFFDGQRIKTVEPIPTKLPSAVIIVFVTKENDISMAAKARNKLRSSARGSKLTEKLIKSRKEDLELERK